jgi:glycosyltransferase involved in cell wall biosynthesis
MSSQLPAHPEPCASPAAATATDQPELSIVLPCLNEAETLEACISKAKGFLEAQGIQGEVVVADNGSHDGSPDLARRLGARVVEAPERGYGSALQAGIATARGRYVIMGDADDSYDFSALEGFVEQLRGGCDLVMGNRFRGGIRPGAMPWMHRWVGNPLLSALGRLFFRAPVGDFHCGLRGFTKQAYDRLHMRATGMEFASEMVVKAAFANLRISEVPTVLHPDGRSRRPHLRTWRDGWRHLRFLLLFSPRWLFLVPGTLLFVLGGLVGVWLLGGSRRVGPAVLDVHTLLVAGMACLLGYQLVVFAIFTTVFAIPEGFQPTPAYLGRLFRYVTLEVGLVVGLLMALGGFLVLGFAVWSWRSVEFGSLDPRVTMRQVVPGAVLFTLGVQTIFSSFFLSILGLRRHEGGDSS